MPQHRPARARQRAQGARPREVVQQLAPLRMRRLRARPGRAVLRLHRVRVGDLAVAPLLRLRARAAPRSLRRMHVTAGQVESGMPGHLRDTAQRLPTHACDTPPGAESLRATVSQL